MVVSMVALVAMVEGIMPLLGSSPSSLWLVASWLPHCPSFTPLHISLPPSPQPLPSHPVYI